MTARTVAGVALAALLAAPAAGQIIPTGTPAADILLTQAIAEHRVFLTCSALQADLHQEILANWQRDVTDAAAVLAGNAIPAPAIAAFQTAADPANLLPLPDTPYADVKQLCDANPDWQSRYAGLSFTRLPVRLPEVFQ